MIEEEQNNNLLEQSKMFKSEIRSHFKGLLGFFIFLMIVWGIFGLVSISGDIYLISIVFYFIALPASGILGLLILITLLVIMATVCIK